MCFIYLVITSVGKDCPVDQFIPESKNGGSIQYFRSKEFYSVKNVKLGLRDGSVIKKTH